MNSLPGTSTQISVSPGTEPGCSNSPSTRFTSFLRGAENLFPPAESPEKLESMLVDDRNNVEMPTKEPPPELFATTSPADRTRSMVITRQEAITLSHVLGRIPPTPLQGTSKEGDCSIQLDINDDPPHSPIERPPEDSDRQEIGPSTAENVQYSTCEYMAPISRKWREPKYTLRTNHAS